MRRAGAFALLAFATLAGCGPPPGTPKRANASKVAEGNPQAAMLWPSLLQHCLRTPECDPMSNFGEGAGEASGIEGSATWFADADTGRILVSLNGYRGQGGDAGRPLAPSETPRNLRARRDNRTWLVLDYPAGSAETSPASIRLRTPQVVFLSVEEARSVRRQLTATDQWAGSLAWPSGQAGARLDVVRKTAAGEAETLLSLHAVGAASGALLDDDELLKLPSAPWLFDVTVDLVRAPGAADALIAAIAGEEPLVLQVTVPGDGLILQDTLYSDGLAQALVSARAALADPAIARPLTERCAPFVAEPMSFWANEPDVSPAVLTCDPRTPEQRARDRAQAD